VLNYESTEQVSTFRKLGYNVNFNRLHDLPCNVHCVCVCVCVCGTIKSTLGERKQTLKSFTK
jgi:hypothetical protein